MIRRSTVAQLKSIFPHGLTNRYRDVIATRRRKRLEDRTLAEWESSGCPIPPPPIVKQQIVKRYAHEYGTRTLIETGTYRGDMVDACSREFTRIISIELDPDLHASARQRFASNRHIEIHRGDSADLLPRLIEGLPGASLFWLDGHYSAGATARGTSRTPIMDELHSICEMPDDGHVILIDDARLFVGKDDYPTVDEVREFVLSRRLDYEFDLEFDIMRIVPSQAKRLSGDLP